VSKFDSLPVLRAPMAVVAFEGWNDAADAASTVVDHLAQAWQARPVTTLDPEDFYDFQVTRPMLTRVDDARTIEWPTTRFVVASPPGAERDVVLIRGIEPSMRWRSFCDQILEVCHALEVRRLVLLGALLADVPHTRPLPVSGSGSSAAAERLRITPTRYEGPVGIVGVLHEACARAELETFSFWVHVPHYANSPPCPKATLGLLHRVEEVLDLPMPILDLPEQAAEWEARVQGAAEQDAELAAYVRELEARAGDPQLHPLTGDEIASEFEKYLRRRDAR
jgi:hypothetical protein